MDSILAHLRQKAPGVDGGLDVARRGGSDNRQHRPSSAAAGGGGGSGGPGSEAGFSVKSELARGLREVKGRIKGLEDRLATKKKALAAEGGATGAQKAGAR